MNSKDAMYSWHLSLRVDRPVEGCSIRPHAYMYGKKLDSNDPNQHSSSNHTKTSREPPPNHEFSYRWFRGPTVEPCAFEGCPRRTSFSPHDWSKHALGGSGCSLQCVSAQSSLYKATFCNSDCFVKAWKTQYTIQSSSSGSSNSDGNGNGIPQARSSTPLRKRTGSYCDDDRSVGSQSTSGNDGNYIPATPGDNSNSNTTMNNPYSTQLSNEDTEWIEISRDQLYIPHAEDIGRKLKVEASAYSVDTGELLMHRVVKTDLVLSRTPEPEKRNLVTAKPAGGGGARFRIVTYNILAEIYATQQQYPYADLWALSWDFRFQNIIREIVDVGPDIVCLQEVQADHYESHLYNAMHEAGFEGVYKQKTRQAMGMTGKVDGCALFWRRTKFHLVESYSIEFNELAQRQVTQGMGLNPRSEEGASILNKLSKDNVAQLVVLETAQPSMSRGNREPNQVCIANTHLYSNKDCPDVKLWQTLHLLQELETFIMARGPANLPLMICGDFNSTPDSAVYDLLSRQLVHPGHPDVNTGDENGPSVLPDIMSITHSHMLGSVYNTVLGEEPKFTNYTMQFKGVLDYMWYSTRNLRPLSAAPIPDESVLTRHGDALPSTQYSSDHLMQISDMQIVSGGSR